MKCFLGLLKISIQEKFYYRINLWLNLLTPSILLGGQYLLWNSLYNLNDSFGNLKRNDMYT